jgi:hypothetical protein
LRSLVSLHPLGHTTALFSCVTITVDCSLSAVCNQFPIYCVLCHTHVPLTSGCSLAVLGHLHLVGLSASSLLPFSNFLLSFLLGLHKDWCFYVSLSFLIFY